MLERGERGERGERHRRARRVTERAHDSKPQGLYTMDDVSGDGELKFLVEGQEIDDVTRM